DRNLWINDVDALVSVVAAILDNSFVGRRRTVRDDDGAKTRCNRLHRRHNRVLRNADLKREFGLNATRRRGIAGERWPLKVVRDALTRLVNDHFHDLTGMLPLSGDD